MNLALMKWISFISRTAVISHVYFLKDGSTTAAAIIGKDGIVGLSAILDAPRPSYWSQVTIGELP